MQKFLKSRNLPCFLEFNFFIFLSLSIFFITNTKVWAAEIEYDFGSTPIHFQALERIFTEGDFENAGFVHFLKNSSVSYGGELIIFKDPGANLIMNPSNGCINAPFGELLEYYLFTSTDNIYYQFIFFAANNTLLCGANASFFSWTSTKDISEGSLGGSTWLSSNALPFGAPPRQKLMIHMDGNYALGLIPKNHDFENSQINFLGNYQIYRGLLEDSFSSFEKLDWQISSGDNQESLLLTSGYFDIPFTGQVGGMLIFENLDYGIIEDNSNIKIYEDDFNYVLFPTPFSEGTIIFNDEEFNISAPNPSNISNLEDIDKPFGFLETFFRFIDTKLVPFGLLWSSGMAWVPNEIWSLLAVGLILTFLLFFIKK